MQQNEQDDALDLRFLVVVGVLAFLVIAVSHASLWLMRVG